LCSNFQLIIGSGGDIHTFLENSLDSRPSKIWTKEEDELLMALTSKHGTSWTELLKYFKNRCATDLSQRYTRLQNYLQKNEEAQYITGKLEIKRGSWTNEETKKLEDLVYLYGENFQTIASLMESRTIEQCKARYNYLTNRSMPISALDMDQLNQLKQGIMKHGIDNIKLMIRKSKLPLALTEEDVKQFYWRELEPNINKTEEWTKDEILTMVQLYDELDGCMELVQSRLRKKRGLNDMWNHYRDYIRDNK
jgi:hypothetical protein